METQKFTTVKQIEKHVASVKKKVDAFKAKVPNVSVLSYNISDISVDLIYKIYDYIKVGKPSYYSSEKIEFRNDRLNLFAWSKFGMTVSFSTVKVKKECDCIDRKEFVEVVEEPATV